MNPPKITKKTAVSNFKTRIKVVLFWLLVMVIVYSLYFAANMFPVIAGYGAKELCSCVYIQGRSESDVINQEFNQFLGKLGSFSINTQDSSATGKVWFFTSKKAIYRKGLGCTLINGVSEDELRSQSIDGKPDPIISQDSIAWPDGNLLSDSLPRGVNKSLLDKLVESEFIETNPNGPINTRAIVVVYKGVIVSEKYKEGFDINTPQMGWSMAKSVTNAMVGISVRQGKLIIEDPAPIQEWKNDKRKKITLNNLLKANSGLDWAEVYSRPSDATQMLFREKDAGHYAISVKAAHDPEERFSYSSGSTNILQKVMRQQLGDEQYHALPYDKLFEKIGMQGAIIEVDPSGGFVGSSFCYATARDWARFGLLYLNDGVWNEERILPEGWVKYTTTPSKGTKKGEYGSQWWLNVGASENPNERKFPSLPTDTFVADGVYGQFVFVVPSKNLVVVRLGLSIEADPDMDKFISALIEALPKS